MIEHFLFADFHPDKNHATAQRRFVRKRADRLIQGLAYALLRFKARVLIGIVEFG